MKTKNLIILTIVSVLAFISCEREVGRYDFTEALLQIIPYEKGQVISFIDSAGQTIDFTVTKSELVWLKNDIEYDNNHCNDYIMVRSKTVILKSELDNIEIALRINAYGYKNDNNNALLSLRPFNRYTRWQDFYLYFDEEGNILYKNISTFFHDSVEINGKVYFDVIEQRVLSNDGITSQPYNILLQLFYNKTYGILQFKRDGENFLMLNN